MPFPLKWTIFFAWLAAVPLTSGKSDRNDQVLHNRDSIPEGTAIISIPGRRLILYLASEHFFFRGLKSNPFL